MKLEDKQVVAALRIIKEVLDAKGDEFVLIGGLVPSILINYGLSSIPNEGIRETKDIDTVLFVQSWEDYEQTKRLLVTKGFREVPREPEHRLFYGNVEVDLIPAGADLITGGQIIWPKSYNVLNMAGITEVRQHAHTIKVDDFEIRVAPLWALAMLKVFACADRNKRRDAYDLLIILNGYEMNADHRLDAPAGTDYSIAGAYVCGLDILKCVGTRTMELLLLNIEKIIENGEYSQIISHAILEAKTLDTDEERVRLFDLVQSFKKGLTKN